MSQSQTSGYDLLVQLSEQELNAQMLTASPLSSPIPIAAGTVTGTVQPAFDHLELDISSATSAIPNCVRIFVAIDVTASLSSFSFTGMAEIGAPVEVVSSGTQRQLIVNFNSTNSAVPYVSIVADQTNKQSIADLCEAPLRQYLKQTLQFFALGPPIDMPPSADPLTPTDVHVKVIDDPNPLGIDCVTFMLNTGGSTGGNAAGVTKFLGASPNGAVVVLSNQLLLERIIRPALASQLGATFNPPCTLASRVLIYEYDKSQRIGGVKFGIDMEIYLESMTVSVEGDHLRAVGSVGGSGGGWKVSGSFSVRLYLELSGGTISVRQETDQMDAEFDFKWWVWVLMVLTAGTLGLLIVAFVQAAINVMIDKMISSMANLASKLGSISVPSIPLGPGGGTLEIQSVLLDDLTLQGPVKRIPASAVGLSLRGDLVTVRKETTIVLNGNTATAMQLMTANAGLPYTVTRRLAFRGVFGAVAAQPLMPVAFQWNLGGVPLTGSGPQSMSLVTGSGPTVVFHQTEGAHCWLWTAPGTSIYLQLAVTMTDGAGHSSHTHMMLQRNATEIETGVTEGIKHATVRDDLIASVLTDTSLTGDLGTLGGVITVDRKLELQRAVDMSRGPKVPVPAAKGVNVVKKR